MKIKFVGPKEVIQASKSDLEESKEPEFVIKKVHNLNVKNEESETRWMKPNENLENVNWDASIHKDKNRIGIGVVIRD